VAWCGVANLEEGVAELGAVAEAVELGAQGRALGAVFVARDVSDVGHPSRRVRSALQALAVTAANGGWIFVTVKPRAGWIAFQQAGDVGLPRCG
jgi:hypothetical protein